LVFWNYSGIGKSGIITEMGNLELYRNFHSGIIPEFAFWNYSGIATLELAQ
jgi:hypothetical protein